MVFENMKLFARQFGLKEEDLTYLKINKILGMYYNYTTFKNIPDLRKEIFYNKNEFNFNNSIKLTEVILYKSDLFVVKNHNKINFIVSKKAKSKILYLHNFNKIDYNKNIIYIETAIYRIHLLRF